MEQVITVDECLECKLVSKQNSYIEKCIISLGEVLVQGVGDNRLNKTILYRFLLGTPTLNDCRN